MRTILIFSQIFHLSPTLAALANEITSGTICFDLQGQIYPTDSLDGQANKSPQNFLCSSWNYFSCNWVIVQSNQYCIGRAPVRTSDFYERFHMQDAVWRQIYLSNDLCVFSVQETDADNTKGTETPIAPKMSSCVFHRINSKSLLTIESSMKIGNTPRVLATSRLDWVWPVSNRTFVKILRYDEDLFLCLCKGTCLLSLHEDHESRILKIQMWSLHCIKY